MWERVGLNMKNRLVSPCSYQGAKQRVAKEIIDIIFKNENVTENTVFYDLCCGSGAITVELLNNGIKPSQIVMCDKSVWGTFWKVIGDGTFDIEKFYKYSKQVPRDRGKVQEHIKELSKTDATVDCAYKYILLQASSFGGKQIWVEGKEWKNTSFRSYWQPTETSNRRSPVNPMQPTIDELENRVDRLVKECKGIKCYNIDIYDILEIIKQDNRDLIIYMDPPYEKTTGYGFTFDYKDFLQELRKVTTAPIYVSEKEAISKEAVQLKFSGAKGGISGNKKCKNEEWLNIFK